jgi:hypothetical protein
MKKMQIEVEAESGLKNFAVILIAWEEDNPQKIVGTCAKLGKDLAKLKKRGKIDGWRLQSIHEP